LKPILLALFAVLALTAAAQTQAPPTPPACLAGPVTQGNVTASCSLVDATGGTDGNFAAPAAYLFAVKASSSDSAVPAIQIQLTFLLSSDPNSAPVKRSVTAVRNAAGGFSYVFILQPVYDQTGTIAAAPSITGLKIDELKSNSSQSF